MEWKVIGQVSHDKDDACDTILRYRDVYLTCQLESWQFISVDNLRSKAWISVGIRANGVVPAAGASQILLRFYLALSQA